MPRSPDAVRRVVAILNFFVDHPGQAFTLAELVRALQLGRATCLGLLTGLVEAGYVYRTNDKSYLLGPALLAVSDAVRESSSPLTVARPEMRALADRYGAVASAAFREGIESIVRERASAAAHVGYTMPRGARLPLTPQVAGIFFVWSSAAEVNAWLAEFNPPPSPRQLEAMRGTIQFARTYGFAFAIRSDEHVDGLASLDLYGRTHTDRHMLFAATVNASEHYDVGVIQAPVYDRRTVAFVLNVQGFSSPRTGREIIEMGEHVRDAAERISCFMDHTRERTANHGEELRRHRLP